MTADSNKPSFPEFSQFRTLTFSIAYRMLGSVAEAEDIVQEAFLRLHTAQTDGVNIESPRAYLAAITTRLAIDHLRSARVRRESYVGTWLPEPVVDEKEPAIVLQTEMGESLSMAFLLILESLSPIERAVFLLREVFDYEYSEVSQIVEKSEVNCRQVFARAKRHIDSGKPRFEVSAEKRTELAQRFISACQSGDLSSLVDLLATDAVFYGDGGGKATAILRPVEGRDKVARLVFGIFSKGKAFGIRVRHVTVNGGPGVMVFDDRDHVISVFSLDVLEGKIHAIRTVINPDKLAHLGPVSELTRLRSRGGPGEI
jgi:RNA polymerase sigma-70 factor, ECF subfamily